MMSRRRNLPIFGYSRIGSTSTWFSVGLIAAGRDADEAVFDSSEFGF